MFKKAILPVLLIIVLGGCTTESDTGIAVTVTPSHFEGKPALKVNMQFPADTSGISILEYPNDAWGQNDLHQALKGLQMKDVEGTITMDRDSGHIVLKHPKTMATIHFEYQIVQDFEEDIASQRVYRPIVQPHYFHVFSHNLFALPKNQGEELHIQMEWKDFPKDYVIHNSFGSQDSLQELTVLRKDFGSAIFVGGDFRVHTDSIQGNAISLATRGDWVPFEEEEVFDVLQQTLTIQRNFWNDHSQAFFTVTLQPFPQETGSSFQGTGLTNSFATSVSNNEHTDLGQLVYLFNHELMHNWIGLTIENENEEEQYWFSEGFTEYYAFKNIAKNNINGLGKDYFIGEINRSIKSLRALPIHGAPNSEINYDNFWSNGDYQKLPYYRGSLFAFYLDSEIWKRSKGEQSLDDVMKIILRDAVEKGQKLTHEYFLEVMTPFYGEALKTAFQDYILEGKALPFATIFEEIGLEFEGETDIYELGFELSEDGSKVLSVTEGSNAQKAGLRAGDTVTSRSIWFGATDKPVELGLTRLPGKTLRFFPVKRVHLPILLNSEKNRDLILP